MARLLVLLPLLVSCATLPANPGGSDGTDALYSETRPAMSTLVTISVAGPPSPETVAAVDAAFAVFTRVEEVMNEWRPGSPLSALNAAAGSGRAVPLPGDL